jgi:hypothetical protein
MWTPWCKLLWFLQVSMRSGWLQCKCAKTGASRPLGWDSWDAAKAWIARRLEGLEEWVNLGTLYRRLVEPLDIANYYRHSKNEDTGSYLSKGRPRRYKYTQKWHEQLQRIPFGSSLESCFWAIVEELQAEMSNGRSLEDMRDCQRSGNSEYSSERSFLTCMRMKWKV